MVLPGHRSQPADLPEQPLQRLVAAALVLGNEALDLVREIQQDPPDSNSESGSPPSAGAPSTMAGMRLLGEVLRNPGANCSPRPMSTGTMRYSRPDSSRNMVSLWPLGVVH